MPAGAGCGVWCAQHGCEPHCINIIPGPVCCEGPGKQRKSGTYAGSTCAVYALQLTLLCLHHIVSTVLPVQVQSRRESTALGTRRF